MGRHSIKTPRWATIKEIIETVCQIVLALLILILIVFTAIWLGQYGPNGRPLPWKKAL